MDMEDDKIEEALDRQELMKLMEEGVFDFLFKRWRQDGAWKGGALGKKQAGKMEKLIVALEEVHKAVGPFYSEFPRKTKLIRGNVQRAISDLEDIMFSIQRGRTEKRGE